MLAKRYSSKIEGLFIETAAFTSSKSGYSSESPSPPSRPAQFRCNEDLLLYTRGYKKISVLSTTLQGQLYKCSTLSDSLKPKYVAIKRTSKDLYQKKIAIEDGINFCVSENIIKEACILKYLTADNTPIGGYIISYIDFFESDSSYYLVMEYIESETNLAQFVQKAQMHIKNGKLTPTQYQKMIKYLIWQTYVTVQWLHVMRCTHLDLCCENIMLKNANFIHTTDGNLMIDPKISIKLCDFGVAEVHDCGRDFCMSKQGLSITNEGYFSPKVFAGERFDSVAADNWSLGMILYSALTVGKRLYEPLTMHNNDSGYAFLCNNRLKEYLSHSHDQLLQYFNAGSCDLLLNLLSVNEKQRLGGMDILKHRYFQVYFARYEKQILKKFRQQKQRIFQQNQFPFYSRSVPFQ